MTPNMEIPHIYAFCPFSNAWKYSFNELVTLARLNANSFFRNIQNIFRFGEVSSRVVRKCRHDLRIKRQWNE